MKIVLDVRGKFEGQKIPGSVNIPVDEIMNNLNKLNKESTYYVHCASGMRSSRAVSILKSLGYKVFDLGSYDSAVAQVNKGL